MEIRTSRLLLREFSPDDLPAVQAYHRDPRYLRYYEEDGTPDEGAERLVSMFLERQRALPRTKFHLAVTLDGRLVGNCGLRMDAPEAREGDIGAEFDPAFWGRGYGTEAAHALLCFGFTELGLHRIWARVVADNLGSVRVMQKAGMRLEGRLKDKEWFRGRWWDSLIFAMLEEEWRASTPPG